MKIVKTFVDEGSVNRPKGERLFLTEDNRIISVKIFAEESEHLTEGMIRDRIAHGEDPTEPSFQRPKRTLREIVKRDINDGYYDGCFENLSDKERVGNGVGLGSWERLEPCPPAATGKYKDHVVPARCNYGDDVMNDGCAKTLTNMLRSFNCKAEKKGLITNYDFNSNWRSTKIIAG